MTGGASDGLAVEEWSVHGGPRLILVHGSMDRATSFHKVARRLPEVDCTLYDRRGYGGSMALGPASSIDQQVDDLLLVVDGRPAMVFGHSFGGVLALAAASRHPELVRSVLAFEAPWPWVEWWPKDSAGGRAVFEHTDDPPAAAEAFMRRMIGDERWERLPPSTRQSRRDEGPALLAEMIAVRRRPPPYDPSAIEVPVVAICGSLSHSYHRRAAAELAMAVPGARLVDVDGAGHGAHLTHPDALASVIRGELDRQAGHDDQRS